MGQRAEKVVIALILASIPEAVPPGLPTRPFYRTWQREGRQTATGMTC